MGNVTSTNTTESKTSENEHKRQQQIQRLQMCLASGYITEDIDENKK